MNTVKTESNSPEVSRTKNWPCPLNVMRIQLNPEARVNSKIRNRLTIKPRVSLQEIAERTRHERLIERRGGHMSLIDRSKAFSAGF